MQNNIGAIIGNVSLAIIIIVAIAFLSIFIYIKHEGPQWKGKAGERRVIEELSNLSPEHYIILNDIYLASRGNTKTTQIDHIVISNYGIFCIETKAYRGWIFGGAKQKYWKQVIYKYQGELYNPLWQNFAHIKAMEGLLGSNLRAPIISLIVFTRASKLRISGTDSVVNSRDIVGKIRGYHRIVYTHKECNNISGLLEAANIVDEQLRKSNINEIRTFKKSLN